MSKSPSPLLGYNNNFRHKDHVFHIQTEDSGVKHPHIITHLFCDGGRIVKSVKTSYAEHLGNERMGEIVKEMMKQQHKAMIVALRDGQFDFVVEELARAKSPAKAAAKAPSAKPPPVAMAKALSAPPAAPAATPPSAVPEVAPKVAASVAAPAAASPPDGGADDPLARTAETPITFEDGTERPPPPSSSEPLPLVRTAAEELTLDIDALERAAAIAETQSPLYASPSDLPPPPANLFRAKTATGQYRAIAANDDRLDRNVGGAVANSTGTADARKGSGARPSLALDTPAGSRPASLFGQARPRRGQSVFGEDLISDKSLDEVILSYLAEDLDGDK
jgi:hypothetical protein